jgi:hypothetical protein
MILCSARGVTTIRSSSSRLSTWLLLVIGRSLGLLASFLHHVTVSLHTNST